MYTLESAKRLWALYKAANKQLQEICCGNKCGECGLNSTPLCPDFEVWQAIISFPISELEKKEEKDEVL